MVGFDSGDEVQVGLTEAELGQSGLQAGERLEQGGWGGGGGGEAGEYQRGGEAGGVLSSPHTLDKAQLAAGFEELGELAESVQIVVDGGESNTAREDLIKVSRLIVGQSESLDILHADLL